MNKSRIQAFTILELIITMLITAIVIGITYSAYSIVSRYYISYQKKGNEYTEINTLDMRIKRDFSRADSIIKTDKGFSVKINNNIINYEIDSSFTLKTTTVTDTFKINLHDINMFYLQHPINQYFTNSESNLIDELSFSILFHKEKITYHYHKDYSSQTLLNSSANAIN